MKDRYHNTEEATNRLVRDFYKHNNIIIAVDFDNTLFDFMKRGFSESIRNLMAKLAPYRVASKYPNNSSEKDPRFTIMLFTAREGTQLQEAVDNCHHWNIRIDYVNKSPVMPKMRKPFYNILLDDKAGLGQAYEVLTNFLKIIDYEY